MNSCVNSLGGTHFLSSKKDSSESQVAKYIFSHSDKCIEEVGPGKVVQVVTDNASTNMAATDLVIENGPNIFWTSCAIQTGP